MEQRKAASRTAEDGKVIERVVVIQLMRLNAPILGLTMGLLLGLALFVATNILVIKGGELVGPHLSLLGQFFLGYRVTFVGSIIGFAYAFVVGFTTGYVFARLYNWLASFREDGRSGNEKSPLTGQQDNRVAR